MASINYTPPPTLKRFMLSNHRRRWVRGPIGSGKTTAMVMELLRRAIQQVPCTDGVRRSRWLVTRLTMPQLKDTVYKTWFQWLPEGEFGHFRATDNSYHIKFNDVECEVLFRPLESPSDISRVLSLELTGAWIAECRDIPIELVEAIDGRLGRYPNKSMLGGKEGWVGLIGETNSPVEGSDWWRVFEHLPLVEGDSNSVMDCETFVQPSPVDENYALLPDAENAENLRSDYYQMLCTGKTEEFIRVYVRNEYGRSREGTPVYEKSFRVDKHRAKKRIAIDGELPIIVGMDFGLTSAAVICQPLMETARLNVLRELIWDNTSTKMMVLTKLRPMIRSLFPNNPLIIIGDPSGMNRAQTDGQTNYGVLRDEGFNARPAKTNDPLVRIGALEEMLSSYPMGEPMIQIDPSCQTLLAGLSGGYMFRINSKGMNTKEGGERPVKNRFSHVVEALQYAAMYYIGSYDRRDFPSQRRDDPLYTPNIYRPADAYAGY